MLASVAAFFHAVEDFPPDAQLNGIGAGQIQLAHRAGVQRVALLFKPVDFHNVFIDGIGLAEVAEFLERVLEHVAAADNDVGEFQRFLPDGRHVEHIGADEHILDGVGNVVDFLNKQDNILPLDGG